MTLTTASPSPRENAKSYDAHVQACAQGDRDSFLKVFNFYAPRVKAYLRRLNTNESEAEELTQEVMLTVWRKASQFDPEQASASTWIFRIARNRRIDLARKVKPDLDAQDPSLHPVEPAYPDEDVLRLQQEHSIREALQDLPEDQVELLKMAFFDGLSHRDIAGQTQVPLGTVKSRLRLAFDKLRKVLSQDLF